MKEEKADCLDFVLITPTVFRVWMNEVVPHAVSELIARGANLDSIPDERGRVEEDGSLTIYVDLPGGIEVKMSVPPDQWDWKGGDNDD